MSVIYQIKAFPNSSTPIADWIGIDAFREANYTNYAPYTNRALDVTGVTNPPPNDVLWGVLFGGSGGEVLSLNIPVNSGILYRIETYHLIPSDAVGSDVYNVAIKCDGVTKAIFTRTNQGNKIFQTSFLYKTVDSNLDLDFVPDGGRFAAFSAVRITEFLKAKFKVSNANPQKGETVTIVDESVNEVGATKSWTLNDSPISQAQIDAGLPFSTSGTKKLVQTLSDGTNTVTFERYFYVGDLVGSLTVAKGAPAQYLASFPNAKYSTDLGTIDANGNFISNVAGTANIKATENIWSFNGSSDYVVQNDNNIRRVNPPGFVYIDFNCFLKNSGDLFEFEIPVYWDANNLVGIIDGTNGYGIYLANGNLKYSLGNGTEGIIATGITVSSGNKIKFVINDSGLYEAYKNGVLIGTRPTVAPLINANGNYCRIQGVNEPVGTIIKRPNYVSSSVPQKLDKKSITVFDPPPSTVTNLTATKISNSRIDLNSDAATDNGTIVGYLTQVSVSGGAWVSLDSGLKALSFVAGNTGFPTAYTEHKLRFRRVARDDAGNYSVDWSNITPEISITIYPPPVIRPMNGLFAQTGKSFQVQLEASGGTNNFNWSETIGNLNGAMNQSGLVTIPLVGNANYTFTARATDVNTNAYDEEAFTIIVTPYAAIAFCHRRPLQEEEILKQRVFEPVQGDDEVAEDASPQYQFTLSSLYVGAVALGELRAFLTAHRKRQKFYWINPDLNNQALLVKRVDNYKANHALNYGNFEFTLRTIKGFEYVG